MTNLPNHYTQILNQMLSIAKEKREILCKNNRNGKEPNIDFAVLNRWASLEQEQLDQMDAIDMRIESDKRTMIIATLKQLLSVAEANHQMLRDRFEFYRLTIDTLRGSKNEIYGKAKEDNQANISILLSESA